MNKIQYVMATLAVGLAVVPAALADDDDPMLNRAAKRGNVQEVQRLIQAGANVNSSDDDGETALP